MGLWSMYICSVLWPKVVSISIFLFSIRPMRVIDIQKAMIYQTMFISQA